VLADWLTGQPAAWRAAVTTASLDQFRGYATALTAQLPDAVRVLDPFHVVRLGLACVDDVRRVQQDTLGHRGRRRDPALRHPPAAAPSPRPPVGQGPPDSRPG